ncbi:MAG: DUF3048 domain-containing protein [Armatimonadota bacterium]
MRAIIPCPCRIFGLFLLVAAFGVLVLSGCPSSRRNNGNTGKKRNGFFYRTPILCPLDGVETTTAAISRRPLAVMIENSPRARPQSGLPQACLVYEGITEGGITRFLAIFLHGDPAAIGPVRSARPHFIYLAKEYSPVFIHCGESYEALQILVRDPYLMNLDGIKYDKPFWRDRARRAPHNLYNSAAKVRKFMTEQEWVGQAEQMPAIVTGGQVTGGTPAPIIHISFGGAVRYKLRYEYDATVGAYRRYMDGKLHVDRESEEPILVHNIIIQRVASEPFAGNQLGTYDVRVMGTGTGEFFTRGQRLPLQWRKDFDAALTAYADAGGHALPYQAGQTWVELVPLDDGKVTIEQPKPPTPAPAPAPAQTPARPTPRGR